MGILNQRWDRFTVTKRLTIGANAEFVNEGAVKTRVQTLTAAKTIGADESGSTFVLGLAGGFTATLPLPKRGLKYKFVVGVAPATAYIIATNGGANIMAGLVTCATADDLGASDANADVITFVASQAVVGDWVELESDGTNWFFRGACVVAEGITTATT